MEQIRSQFFLHPTFSYITNIHLFVKQLQVGRYQLILIHKLKLCHQCFCTVLVYFLTCIYLFLLMFVWNVHIARLQKFKILSGGHLTNKPNVSTSGNRPFAVHDCLLFVLYCVLYLSCVCLMKNFYCTAFVKYKDFTVFRSNCTVNFIIISEK